MKEEFKRVFGRLYPKERVDGSDGSEDRLSICRNNKTTGFVCWLGIIHFHFHFTAGGVMHHRGPDTTTPRQAQLHYSPGYDQIIPPRLIHHFFHTHQQELESKGPWNLYV